jgi:hypothetical protein
MELSYFCPVTKMLDVVSWKYFISVVTISLIFLVNSSLAQHSVARQWNEALLQAIREDYARPTVHARNLWHTSVVMYDAWAVYGNTETYLLGKTVGGFDCDFNGIASPSGDIGAAQEEAISYAAYRLLSHRFQESPGRDTTLVRFDSLFFNQGYDASFTSTDYSDGSAAALGNYIAQCMIRFAGWS